MPDLKANKDFSTTRYGNVSQGQTLRDVPEHLAQQWNDAGMTSPASYSTKVVREVPTVAGETSESTSSPADPASPKQTRGKRGKRKAESSPSTAPSGSAPTPTRSTPGTTSGGRTTETTGESSEV